MAYSITTKDGITINNIPDDVAPDSADLKTRVATIRAGGGAAALEAPAPIAPQKEMGFLESIGESITGSARATPETQTLPEWTTMPELNQMSVAGFKTALGSLLSNPKETVQILQANFPGVQVRQDDKGNYLMRSSVDQQEYAIPPGFSMGDIPRAIGTVAAFTPAGRALTIPRAIMGAGATQATIEAAQAGAGGEFNAGEVVAAGALGPTGQILQRAVPPAIQAVKGGLQRITGQVRPPPPPVPPVPPEVAMTAEELTDTTRKAAEGGFGANRATEILATQAAPDPKVLEAARRLNIEGYLQPDHLTSNQAYRELAQAVKSIPGSQARAAEIAGLEQVGKSADDLISQIGGMTDLSRMNQTVRTNLSQTVATLESKADDAYDKLRANIPAQTTGPADNVLNFIEQRVRDLGGDKKNLSPMEQSILAKLSPKPIKDAQGNVTGTSLPTYALIDDVRKDIGAAAREKGQFKDADTGAAKTLYKLIDDDQFNLAETLGEGQQYLAAKSLVAMRKGFEDDMVSLFGKQLDQSLVSKLSTATSSLSKGDAEQLAKILTAIPKDMRKTVAASALNTAFGKATQTGTLNFNTYANWYQGLIENKQAYAALMSNLPQSSRKALSDLYRVSDNVRKASRERITTGRIQSVKQELQGVDSLLNNIFTVAKRAAIGVPIEAVTASIGLPGAGLASGLTSALSKGVKPEVIKKADELIASPEFQRLVIETATEAPSAASIRRAAMSQSFQNFANAVKLPKELDARIQWLQTAAQAERQLDQENQ
jgi:hypothetical protein